MMSNASDVKAILISLSLSHTFSICSIVLPLEIKLEANRKLELLIGESRGALGTFVESNNLNAKDLIT